MLPLTIVISTSFEILREIPFLLDEKTEFLLADLLNHEN